MISLSLSAGLLLLVAVVLWMIATVRPLDQTAGARRTHAISWSVLVTSSAAFAFAIYQLPYWFPEVQEAGWWMFLTPETWDRSRVTKEFGLWENITALAYFSASLLLLVGAFRLTSEPAYRRLFPLALSAGLLLVTGEEISWGQYFIGFNTPDIMQATNRQQEVNIHNLFSNYINYLAIIGVFIVYIGLLPMLCVFLPRLRRVVQHFNVPCPPLRVALPCTLFFILCSADLLLGMQALRWYGLREIRELMLALAVLATTLDWYLDRQPPPRAPA